MPKYVIYGLLLMTTVASVQPLKPVQSSSEPCKDGESTTFDNGCNTCVCGNGNWACTMKLCLDDQWSRTKRKPEDEATCKDGEVTSFDDGCNTCVCGNGNWACTLKLCHELDVGVAKREASPSKECTPHETKQEDCNSCWCTETGLWICTKKGCPKQKRQVVKECAPGDIKGEDCYMCTCTETGIWFCPRLGCQLLKREAIAAGFESRRRRRTNI